VLSSSLAFSFSPEILELEAQGFSLNMVLVGDSHHAPSLVSLMKLSPSPVVEPDFHDGVGESGARRSSGERRPFLTE